MNWADIVVICILLVIFLAVGRSLYRRHTRYKQGENCCNSCAKCVHAAQCVPPQQDAAAALQKQKHGSEKYKG